MDPRKLVFNTVGETWCFGVPKGKEIVQGDDRFFECSQLNVGDIITTRVGHFDYNTATFEVELTVREVRASADGLVLHYTLELTKFPNR